MRILLDSHAFVWMVFGDARFSSLARDAVDQADIVSVSAVTAWELATKVRIGKWPEAAALSADLPAVLLELNLGSLMVTIAHAQMAGSMIGAHKDPFDRMLVAQSLIEDMTLVTADRALDCFGAKTLW